ncbi:MAG: cytochrome c-type biogenesis protein [Hyphomicrobiaceae bacterium]|nr:cytochrome c-type biogenesis protein [Hyphomicrobiaceae bacterium]
MTATLVVPLPARTVEPDEVLANPALEARARALSTGLRCLVCQNQSIDDSNAPLARDLRVVLRERLKAGDSDEQVKAYLVQRYGEFVLLKPPVSPATLMLWGAPVALLLIALGLAVRAVRTPPRTGRPDEAPLTTDEARRLDEILKRDGQ